MQVMIHEEEHCISFNYNLNENTKLVKMDKAVEKLFSDLQILFVEI